MNIRKVHSDDKYGTYVKLVDIETWSKRTFPFVRKLGSLRENNFRYLYSKRG